MQLGARARIFIVKIIPSRFTTLLVVRRFAIVAKQSDANAGKAYCDKYCTPAFFSRDTRIAFFSNLIIESFHVAERDDFPY
jgi:hypothetical protein